MNTHKSKEERLKEILELRKKLHSLGLTEKVNGISELFKLMSNYVKDGFPITGKIKLLEAKRYVIYNFPRNNGNKCTISLKIIK